MWRSTSPLNLQIGWNNTLEYKMVDGIIDIKIFMHSNLNRLLHIYRKSLGSHIVPPFWSMGYMYANQYGNCTHDFIKPIR